MATPKCDWEEVEKRYRTNQGSNRSLAEEFGVSEAAIRKRAKKEGWAKDLVGDFQRELKNRQLKELGTRHGTQCEPAKSKEARDSDRDTVENAVSATIEIVNRQTERIDRLNANLDLMFDDFERNQMLGYTKEGEPFTDYRAKADYMRTMSATLERTVKLERLVHNIGETEGNTFNQFIQSKDDLKSKTDAELEKIANDD